MPWYLSSARKEREEKQRKEELRFWKLVGKRFDACPLLFLPPTTIDYSPLSVLYLKKPKDSDSLPDFAPTKVNLKALASDELRAQFDRCLRTERYDAPQRIFSADFLNREAESNVTEVGAFVGLERCRVDELRLRDWTYEHIDTTQIWRQIDELFRNNITSTPALQYDDSDRRVLAVVTGTHAVHLERRRKNRSIFGGKKTEADFTEKGVIGIQARCYAMRRQTGRNTWEVSDGIPMLSPDPDGHKIIRWLANDNDADGILELPDVLDDAAVFVDTSRLS